MKNLAFSCTIPGPNLRIRYSKRIFLGGSFILLAFFPILRNLRGSAPSPPACSGRRTHAAACFSLPTDLSSKLSVQDCGALKV
jgi:hypothetical protein